VESDAPAAVGLYSVEVYSVEPYSVGQRAVGCKPAQLSTMPQSGRQARPTKRKKMYADSKSGLAPHQIMLVGYSVFTSSAYRTDIAKWRFPQEIVTQYDLAMSISEVKML
jgi:hypothetical protein